MLEIIKTVFIVVFAICLVVLAFYLLVKILKNLESILKVFISVSIPILYVLGIGLAFSAYHYIFSAIYKLNNFIGIAGVIITISALVYYLQKKFDILTFLKQFTGISEYDSKATNFKKFLKILQISFFIIIFSSIAIGIFSVSILSIFNPILAM